MSKLLRRLLVPAFLASLVSSVSAAGNFTGNYTQAADVVLNPSTPQQIRMFYESMGWFFAGVLAVPLAGVLIYGFVLGEHTRENYWLLVISLLVAAIVGFVASPLTILRL